MSRKTPAIGLAILVVTAVGRAEDRPGLAEVLGVQETLQKSIRDAEPAVACILVSRSDAYQRCGQGPMSSSSAIYGMDRLGGFDPGDDAELKKLDLAHPDYVPESFGSGVVLDAKGLILTNYHIVRDATKIYVRLPGRIGSYADIHAADRRSDLAVLRLLNDKLPPLPAIKLGDGGQLKKGQLILTVANPFAAGFRDGSPTASWGLLANVRHKLAAESDAGKTATPATLHGHGLLMQIDARLNLSCSGAAVIDLKGELVGLTTLLPPAGTETGNLAIPIDDGVKRIIDKLREGQEVEYGFIGVSLDRVPDRQDGVTLQTVYDGSPAARAGLRRGDVLSSINGTPLHDLDDLFVNVGTYLAGTPVRLEVRSGPGGPVRTVTTTLAKYYLPGKVIASDRPPAVRGLRVDHTSILAQAPLFRPPVIPDGVAVREVEEKSPAEAALVKVFDVITHVNGRPVRTPADFYQEARRVSGTLELTMLDPPRLVKIN